VTLNDLRADLLRKQQALAALEALPDEVTVSTITFSVSTIPGHVQLEAERAACVVIEEWLISERRRLEVILGLVDPESEKKPAPKDGGPSAAELKAECAALEEKVSSEAEKAAREATGIDLGKDIKSMKVRKAKAKAYRDALLAAVPPEPAVIDEQPVQTALLPGARSEPYDNPNPFAEGEE